MTPAELVSRVQAIADERNATYPNRRKGMPVEVAQRVIAAVVDEVLAVVEPWASNQWGGDVILSRIRGLVGKCPPRPLAAPHSNANSKNGAGQP